MPFYKIDVDEEVWRFLKKHAEPFEDTPNSVLKRFLLGADEKGNGDSVHTRVSDEVPEYPARIPRALAQILEVIYGVQKLGMSRMQATNIAARKRNTAPQTIIDKYCRQLGKRAHEVDDLLRSENLTEFRSILERRFANHRDVVKEFFDSLNN
jgi:hypothetical protein